MRKFLTILILTALLTPLFLANAQAAQADNGGAFPSETKKPKPDPKPDPAPKPGPREGGADD